MIEIVLQIENDTRPEHAVFESLQLPNRKQLEFQIWLKYSEVINENSLSAFNYLDDFSSECA